MSLIWSLYLWLKLIALANYPADQGEPGQVEFWGVL